MTLVQVDLDRKDGCSNSDLVASHESLQRCVAILDGEDLEGGAAAQARAEALEAKQVDDTHKSSVRSASRTGTHGFASRKNVSVCWFVRVFF